MAVQFFVTEGRTDTVAGGGGGGIGYSRKLMCTLYTAWEWFILAADVDWLSKLPAFCQQLHCRKVFKLSSTAAGFLAPLFLASLLSVKVTLKCRVQSSTVGTLEAKPEFFWRQRLCAALHQPWLWFGAKPALDYTSLRQVSTVRLQPAMLAEQGALIWAFCDQRALLI